MLPSGNHLSSEVAPAVLKVLGSNEQIIQQKIFDQEQIARAVQLGPGTASLSEVDLISDDKKSRKYCTRAGEMLVRGQNATSELTMAFIGS